MGDKTVRVRADLHHIIKIETAKNGLKVCSGISVQPRKSDSVSTKKYKN